MRYFGLSGEVLGCEAVLGHIRVVIMSVHPTSRDVTECVTEAEEIQGTQVGVGIVLSSTDLGGSWY
jgi:hypothetical protein